MDRVDGKRAGHTSERIAIMGTITHEVDVTGEELCMLLHVRGHCHDSRRCELCRVIAQREQLRARIREIISG